MKYMRKRVKRKAKEMEEEGKMGYWQKGGKKRSIEARLK